MSKRAVTLGIVALAALGTAVFFLREPDPQAAMRQATRKFLTEKTFHAELKAALVGLSAEPSGVTGSSLAVAASATGVDVTVSADIDRTTPSRPASVSIFTFHQDLANGAKTDLAGEARRKDEIHYLRLDTITGVEGVDASRVTGRWIKADRPFLDLLLATEAPAQALDASGLGTLQAAIGNVDLFTVLEKLPKEKIDGVKAYHYAVTVDMQAVSALMLKSRELRTGVPIEADDILAITAELLQWGKPVGEVWIGAQDRRIRKLQLQTALGADSDGGVAVGTLAFTHFGQAVRVDAPQAEDIEKVLGPLFNKRLDLAGGRTLADVAPEGSGSTALPTAPVATSTTLDSDGDRLSDAQETFYESDAWNPDTDADGYPDGLEVEKGMNPVGPGTLFGFGL